MATNSYFDIFFVVILNKLLKKQYNSVDLWRLDVKATSLWREPQMTKKVAVVFLTMISIGGIIFMSFFIYFGQLLSI